LIDLRETSVREATWWLDLEDVEGAMDGVE
jgi:hypothetical protein